jgi:hypothetical protein
MDTLIDIVKWLGAAVGAVVVLGTLVVGALSWLLNHPD